MKPQAGLVERFAEAVGASEDPRGLCDEVLDVLLSLTHGEGNAAVIVLGEEGPAPLSSRPIEAQSLATAARVWTESRQLLEQGQPVCFSGSTDLAAGGERSAASVAVFPILRPSWMGLVIIEQPLVGLLYVDSNDPRYLSDHNLWLMARVARLLNHVIPGPALDADDAGEPPDAVLEAGPLPQPSPAFRLDVGQDVRARRALFSALARELMAPINEIAAWSDALSLDRVDPSLLRRATDSIARSATAQVHVISEFLEASRMLDGALTLDLHPLALEAVADGAVNDVLARAMESGILLEVALDKSAVVAGDAPKLKQTVARLLSNAFKFTPRGGSVSIRLTRDVDVACLTVQDTGIGIEPALLPHVFDGFRPMEESRQGAPGGLGVGLALARHVVRLHGGTIEAASEGLGKGSTFTIRLPCQRSA